MGVSEQEVGWAQVLAAFAFAPAPVTSVLTAMAAPGA